MQRLSLLEDKVEALAATLSNLTELLTKQKTSAIRKVKGAPKTQASSSSESGSEDESEEVSSDESVDPHKAKPLPPTSIGSRRSTSGSKSSSSKKKSVRMMSFPAKKEAMRSHLRWHEDKLRAIPEDWALAIEDLAERSDLMYDQHTMETADYELRSWGLHFEVEAQALAKLADRRREKQQSQHSIVTGRRGMFWVAEQNACTPNWPLDDIVDEDGIGIHDLKEQWTPLLDTHVDY